MKFKPLNDRVLVKRGEGKEKTKGGIIIPDTAKEKPVEGKVICTGPGKIGETGSRVPMEVKEGDRILYSKWAGSDIKLDGEEYLIMKEEDILAVVK